MVAYTDSLGFYKNSVGFASNYTNRVSVVEIDIDFAKIAAARVAAGATALAATDTLVIATLPKGALIVGGGATLVRAEGASATVDLGITGTLTLFASNFNLNGTVGATSAGTTPAYLTADTDVVMTIDTNSTDAARMKVSIAMINMGADLGSIPNET
jgi:hypothetical protein